MESEEKVCMLQKKKTQTTGLDCFGFLLLQLTRGWLAPNFSLCVNRSIFSDYDKFSLEHFSNVLFWGLLKINNFPKSLISSFIDPDSEENTFPFKIIIFSLARENIFLQNLEYGMEPCKLQLKRVLGIPAQAQEGL